MPKKKIVKKSTTAKKEPKEKKAPDEDENVPAHTMPEYEDPKIFTPRVTLNIALMSPIITELGFQKEVMITTRVRDIEQMIIDRHDGSIHDVTICLG